MAEQTALTQAQQMTDRTSWRASQAMVLIGFLAAACAPMTMPPQQVQASNPTVTYKYRGDQELIQANQNAANFCTQYGAVPHSLSVTDTQDGAKTAVFECVAGARSPAMVVAQPVFAPNQRLSYRTDAELMQGSRDADKYCISRGQQAVSTVSTNPDGTRSMSFQCALR